MANVRFFTAGLVLALAGCGGTAAELRTPGHLRAEIRSPSEATAFADCIHGAWQSRSSRQIGRAPSGSGVSITYQLGSVHGLGSLVDVQPDGEGSIARIYAISHDQGAGPAVAACG